MLYFQGVEVNFGYKFLRNWNGFLINQGGFWLLVIKTREDRIEIANFLTVYFLCLVIS